MTRALSLLLATTALAAIALPARAADADAPPEAAEGDVQSVVVTGQRVFRQGALDESQIVKTEIFDADSVDRAHAVNVNEVLDKNPGIAVQTECSICNVRNITLNNLPGRFTTLMIDGIPLFSSLSSAYGLDSVNVRGIQQIEVARGAGASLIAPEAIAGVINIVTRRPVGTEVEALADAGSFGWRNVQAYAGFGSDRVGLNLTGGYQRHDSVDATGSGIGQYTGYERAIVGGALFISDLAGFDVKLRGDYVHEDRGGGALGSDYAAIKASDSGNSFDWSAGPAASPADDGWFAPDGSGFIAYDSGRGGFSEIIFTRRTQLLAVATRDFGAGSIRIAGGYASNAQESFYELSTYDASGDQVYAELSGSLAIGPARLNAGLSYRGEDLRSTGVNAAGQNNDGIDDYDYKVPGGFIQIYAPLAGGALEVNASARLDDHNVFGTIFSPRVNLLWHHGERLSSRFAAGRGFRAPTSFFEQDHGILDTVRVVRLIDKPETSTNLSYALNYSDDRLVATASYNYTRVRDFALLDSAALDPGTGDPITLFTSAADPVTIQGIDVVATYRAMPGLSLSAGAEKYWFSFTPGTLAFARPDFKAYASADWEIGPLHLFARGMLTGRQDLAAFYGTGRYNLDGTAKRATAPAFVTIDAKAEYHLAGERVSLYVGVDNLTGFNQADSESFLWLDSSGAIDVTHFWGPNRGRFVYAGVKVSL